MSVSIASYTFHSLHSQGTMDIFGYLESMKYRYHLDTADIWNGMLKSTEEDYVLKVREALDERGLCLANLCCDWCQAWDADSAARDTNRQNALAHLRAAALLGAKTVRFDFGGQAPDMTPEQFDWTVARFTEYASYAAENGFLVGPENHYGPAVIKANMLRVAAAVDSKAYGVLLHVGRWGAGEDAGACDSAMAPMVMHTHIDSGQCGGDLAKAIQPLVDAGYAGCYSSEDGSPQAVYVGAALQLAQIRRTLQAQGLS